VTESRVRAAAYLTPELELRGGQGAALAAVGAVGRPVCSSESLECRAPMRLNQLEIYFSVDSHRAET
jgi:hypothetical protein